MVGHSGGASDRTPGKDLKSLRGHAVPAEEFTASASGCIRECKSKVHHLIKLASLCAPKSDCPLVCIRYPDNTMRSYM